MAVCVTSPLLNPQLVFSELRDGVMVLSINNPPVNAIGADVRAALWQSLDHYEHDADVRAIVIAASGPMFSGGGDLRELGQADAPGTISLTTLGARIEACAKPVVAALHGRCIGGGVLLAMACHARLGERNVSLMLPELNLGLIPGAGGTQRLPRLTGVRAALDMVVRNQALDADAALKNGLLDSVCERDVAMHAARYAQVALLGKARWRRSNALEPEQLDAATRVRLLQEYTELAQQFFPGRQAALEVIPLILDASRYEFEQGMSRERQTFAALAAGPQCRALLHLFFAERALAKSEDAPQPEARALLAQRLNAAGLAKLADLRRRGAAVSELPDTVHPVWPPSLVDAMSNLADVSAGIVIGQELRQAVVDEARACLAEGLAARAEYIDVIAVKTCGFPALLGGPLHYAAQK